MSEGNGYWKNYRCSDKTSYDQAVIVQRINKKLVKCELALKFLNLGSSYLLIDY